jgi:F0F1-type ATP synthase assembly protein I
LAQTDHLGVQSTLHQFGDLLVWGLALFTLVCFAVAVWNIHRNARSQSSGHRRTGE